jgi:uncharacterized protein YpmB
MTKTKTVVIIVIVLLLSVSALAFILGRTESTSPANTDDGQPTDSAVEIGDSKINFDPPTQEEQAVGDQVKQEIASEEEQQEETEEVLPNGAEVVLVDASQYSDEIEVRAFVSNIIEDGTCTITFTQGTSSFTEEVPAYADASTTTCIALTVPRSDFTSTGIWDVEIVYTSPSIQGETVGVVTVE